MIEGNFIVFEGIDGSGTSTQAAELRKRFTALGLPAHVTAEPSTGPVGGIIRQMLSGRLVVRSAHGVSPPAWTTMSLLFAADRQDHVDAEILPNLFDGVNVICDRYVYSSIVYQSTSAGDPEAAAWIESLNHHIREPDLVIYLRVSQEVAMRRCRERDTGLEIFDDPEFQARLVEEYDLLEKKNPDTRFVTVDGERSVEEIADECWSHVEELRSPGGVK